MPGLFTSLTGAAYALQTHSRTVQQAGKNIANINNPDYSRQRVVTGTLGTVETTAGPDSGPLLALGLQQIRDTFIDRQIVSEVSYAATLEAQDYRLRQALANLGDTINRSTDAQFVEDIVQQGGGMRGALDSFFNAFESLAARPNDATTRQVVFQEAQGLVDTFNRIDARFDALQTELDQQLQDEVEALNVALGELNDLNIEIARLEVDNPGSALDLRDQRQAKLEEIADYGLIEFEEVDTQNGQVAVGMRDENGDLQLVIDPGQAVKTLVFDAEERGFRIFGQSQLLGLTEGRLPAILEVRDTYVGDIRDDLDTLANTVATRVNELYYQAYTPAFGGNPAVPEISFFQQPTPPPSVSGQTATVTAANIALYSGPSDPSITDYVPLTASSIRSTTAGASGANDLALALADIGVTGLTELGGITLSEFASRTVTRLGQDIKNVQNSKSVQEDVMTVLKERRSEISGVSMDEEVAMMVQYQRAFQASSRYFGILSEMLDTLINGLGR